MNTSPSGGTTPSTDQTLGHILDTLFGAGLTRGELYERGKPGGTITSDALHKAKTAIQALLTQERNKAKAEAVKELKGRWHEDRKTMDYSPDTYDFICDKYLAQLEEEKE